MQSEDKHNAGRPPEEPKTTLARHLRDRGITPRQIADHLGVKEHYAKQMIDGTQKIRKRNAEKIYKFIGETISLKDIEENHEHRD